MILAMKNQKYHTNMHQFTCLHRNQSDNLFAALTFFYLRKSLKFVNWSSAFEIVAAVVGKQNRVKESEIDWEELEESRLLRVRE